MKLVLVEWIDSHSGKGWQPLDELQASAGPVHCRSVGWLVAESNGHKTIVPHVSGEKNGDVRLYGSGDMTIPNKAITKLTVIRPK